MYDYLKTITKLSQVSVFKGGGGEEEDIDGDL